MSSKKTIAIVGAGVSGLQAARTILQHSTANTYNVVIFEARDRIGGRVSTNREWGFPLDFGANFIHGTEGNPLTDVAAKVGSTFVHNISLRRYYDEKGRALDKKTAGFVYRKVWEYSDAAAELSREQDIDKDKSVEDFCMKRLEEDKEIKDDHTRDVVASGVRMLAEISACNLDKLSLRYFWMEDDLPGDRPFVDSTYGPIVQYIAHPSTSKDLIHFNTQIMSINIDTTREKPIQLTSAIKETFFADSVIVTIPLGLLKVNAIQFTPSLPGAVQTAISNLGFGVLEKLFIRFSEPWWLTAVEMSDEPIGLEFYRFPSYLSAKHLLPHGALNFFSLARTHKPQPVFGVFVATDLAKFLVTMSKEELKSMLQTYYVPHLPNYDAANPACQILELNHSAWSQDVFAGFGSYTHIPAGSDTGDESMRILSEMILPAGTGGIWFAGEHTASTEIIDGDKYTTMATVTGAYKSGERAAKHILRHYS